MTTPLPPEFERAVVVAFNASYRTVTLQFDRMPSAMTGEGWLVRPMPEDTTERACANCGAMFTPWRDSRIVCKACLEGQEE